VQSLGAFLELAHLFPEYIRQTEIPSWLDRRQFRRFANREQAWFLEDGLQLGFAPMTAIRTSDTVWTDAANRIKRLSVQAGFSVDHSGKFVAAIAELMGNILDHSQRPETGYIAFHVEPRKLEFVVADRGVGILSSLKSNPEYARLSDHGRAIELALSEGISRYPREEGHGFGFRPLFVGLANIARSLRFRSGDHCREIVRFSDGPPQSRTYELAALDGFLCAVTCEV
jgi:anti-sigma regulatory factor (Ser/Thr protein kinase)